MCEIHNMLRVQSGGLYYTCTCTVHVYCEVVHVKRSTLSAGKHRFRLDTIPSHAVYTMYFRGTRLPRQKSRDYPKCCAVFSIPKFILSIPSNQSCSILQQDVVAEIMSCQRDTSTRYAKFSKEQRSGETIRSHAFTSQQGKLRNS